MITHRFTRLFNVLAITVVLSLGAGYPDAAKALTTDLSPTPPDLSAAVDPNLAVTYDDSGSMRWSHMGDQRPFDRGSWNGPWRCAGVIDPTIDLEALGDTATPEQRAKARAMNGVYYNPNVNYTPPLYQDGSLFPNADASLRKVWLDGIAVNKPSGYTADTNASYINNPNNYDNVNDTRISDLLGEFSSETRQGRSTGRWASCPSNANPGSCICTGTGGNRVCTWDYQETVDNRWQCGAGGSSTFNGANPFDGTNGQPNGGPYYYRFTGTLSVNATTGRPDAAGISALYNADNWEPVPVPTEQYQNFANWYSYYRTRGLTGRTALSRVFGSLGDNVRVTWQTLGNNSSRAWYERIVAGTSIISNLTNLNTTGDSAADNYRNKFFDWIFKVGSNDGTPLRSAMVRAGEFFKQGSDTTLNLKNPYYQPGAGVNSTGMELACRQNFHLMLTDGYWNQDGSFSLPANAKKATDPTTFYDDDRTTPATTPPFEYNPADAETYIYSNNSQNMLSGSLANIAFHYWATDLRPAGPKSLANRVVPYIPDRSTKLDGTGTLEAGIDPLTNKVIYFNPVNDVATWQHVVQFMVALGIDGELSWPDDYEKLRTGELAWPKPEPDKPSAVDDLWHAAINSRGAYFSAADPGALVQQLTNIINSILQRRASSTALSTTMSILTQGTQGYVAGYDSGDWSGHLLKRALDAVTGEPGDVLWDAGCLLTGNGCKSGAATVNAARAPASRKILTSGNGANLFEWSSLSAAQKTALKRPGETDWANAQKRLAYLRGDRTNENEIPMMRRRGSVLGAVVNSQPVYISGPTGGFSDSFPFGTPEADAVATNSYSKFVYDNRNRDPMVYVGANDGMLHAFDAVTGNERWAYVPNMLFENGRLLQLTDVDTISVVPGVDDMPVIQDAFFDGKWRTVLVSSMRMGGRGVFAIDITKPGDPKVLWEFSNTTSGGEVLGYTYGSANIARLANDKWVAIVSSGYFAKDVLDPTSSDPNRDKTSLVVLDLETGAHIRTIETPSLAGVKSFGLSAPAIYDSNSDQIDDYAVVGDLAGNLWRFDLSSASPADWKAELMFKTYTTAPTDAQPPRQPISAMPVALRDPVAGTPVWVFGTGKYLGKEDRTASGSPSNEGPQAFYGIRDYGAGAPTINVADLQVQTLTQATDGTRSLTTSQIEVGKKGWTFALSSTSGDEPGERAVVTAVPLYATNRAVLTTLIPKGADPCDPGRRGSVMIVDAGTGGGLSGGAPISGGTAPPEGSETVGKVVDSSAISLVSPVALIGQTGGGGLLVPGIPELKIPDPPYHRGAWRELFQ